jgi:death on curing protein
MIGVGDAPDTPWEGLTSVARVLDLHSRGLQQYGGLEGPPTPGGCVEGALGAAHSAEMYLEGRRYVIAGLPFAAYALVYLVRRHCFIDGNKRAGWLTCIDILATLGLGVEATVDEAVALVEGVIAGNFEDGAAVATWLAPRLYALP